jgi:hypothetical protein
MTARTVRTSVIAVVVLVAGGCGSAGSKEAASKPKLSLTKAEGRTAAAADASALLYPARPTSYVLDGTLPDLGTQAPVYRWTAHAAGIDEVNQLAAALGINATATTTPDGFQASDGTATLTVTVAYGTTQVSYFLGGGDVTGGSTGGSAGGTDGVTADGSSGVSNGSGGTGTAPETPSDKPLPADPPDTIDLPTKLTPPVDVPSADEAETIARELLDRAGVLAGQKWESDVNASGGIAVSCAVGEPCTSIPEQVTARDVTFHLVLDGVRVEGVGWTVTIGERSRIQSVYGEWASAAVLGNYDLRSTADAFDALKRGDGYFGGVEPLARDVPVNAQDAREPATSVAKPAVEEPTIIDPAPPVAEPVPPVAEPPVSDPPDSVPPPEPLVVHVTGVSLGIARWTAVDGNQNVVDLVPTYVFHTSGADGPSSDITQLALDPAVIDFAKPIELPKPVPQPGTPTPEPLPAPDRGSGSGSAPAASTKVEPAP